jgi:glycine betaine/proline transport system ATP-binding protein
VRLADRIAIMRDGEVIQVDTPEQLILNPANSYVEEFTKRISRLKVLTVASLMKNGAPAGPVTVKSTSLIAEVASAVLGSNEDVTVIDNSGAAVGSLSRAVVISLLTENSSL